MHSEFAAVQLGKATLNHDRRRVPVKKLDRRPGPFPYYGASGVADYVDDFIFEGLHLLISEDGENLKTRNTPIAFLANGRFWVNNHAHIVQGNSRADTRYLCYALQVIDISPYLSGSTRPKLTKADLNRIEIPLPPLPEQHRIAAVLGALDDKIELNRKMNQTLEEMAQAIFKSWFVDFDGHEDLVDSELGPIPRGWEVGQVANLATLTTVTVKPHQQKATRWEHYSIPAYDDGERPTHELGSSIKSNKYAVPPEAVLVSKLNPRFPRIWMPQVKRREHAICSTEFMPFVPIDGISRAFVYDYFWSPAAQQSLLSRVTGTTGSHQRVKPKEIAAMPAVIPSRDAVERFSEVASPLHLRRLSNIAESKTLAELRDTLLPKLISGEIRVPEAEAAIEEVV